MSYQNIAKNVSEINSQLDGKRQIQKIYSTSRFLCLSIRCFQKNVYVYIGRGKNYEGIWIGENIPSKEIRAKDRFLELLRKYIRNKSLSGIDIDRKDRILRILFQDKINKEEFYIAWIGRDCYFALSTEEKKIISWDNKVTNISFDLFDQIGRTDIEKNLDKKIIPIEVLLEEELQDSKKQVSQTKKENKKIKKIGEDIKRLKQFISLKELLKNNSLDEELNLMKMQIKKFGIKVNLKDCKTIFQKKDQFYKKIKNVEKAILIQEERYERFLSKEKPKEELNNLKTILPIWSKQKEVKEITKSETKKEYIIKDFNEYTIGVGNSAQGNDQLRKWAKNEDVWVHLKDLKSAHAIIKCKNLSLFDDALFQAAKLIVGKSDKEFSEVDIIYTKVANLKAVKGSPGMVNFKKEKSRRIIFS